jgi:hypothetical protein
MDPAMAEGQARKVHGERSLFRVLAIVVRLHRQMVNATDRPWTKHRRLVAKSVNGRDRTKEA